MGKPVCRWRICQFQNLMTFYLFLFPCHMYLLLYSSFNAIPVMMFSIIISLPVISLCKSRIKNQEYIYIYLSLCSPFSGSVSVCLSCFFPFPSPIPPIIDMLWSIPLRYIHVLHTFKMSFSNSIPSPRGKAQMLCEHAIHHLSQQKSTI